MASISVRHSQEAAQGVAPGFTVRIRTHWGPWQRGLRRHILPEKIKSLVVGRPPLQATKCPPGPDTGVGPLGTARGPKRGHGKGGKNAQPHKTS